ncbi:hypothetical protein GO730_00215 [Spirosoma sp. HMF3257]|nr:hypothetical protein [Spirosoma telluris]
MYITGQRSDQFIKDVSKATLNFKIIKDFAVEGSFYQRIAIINKNASGFDKSKSGLYLQQMESVIEQEAVVDAENNIEELLSRIPLN